MGKKTLLTKYPFLVMIGVFVTADLAAVFAAPGNSLAEQMTGQSLSAAVVLTALLVWLPQTTDDRIPADKTPKLLVAALMGIGLIGGVATVAASAGGLEGLQAATGAADLGTNLIVIMTLCLAIGVYEEGFFRGLAIPAAFLGSRQAAHQAEDDVTNTSPLLSAVIFSVGLFAVLHVVGPLLNMGNTGSATEPTRGAFVLIAMQMVFKVIQAAFFGVIMAALFLRSGAIWVPAFCHAGFDLLYCGPLYLSTGAVPATYLTGTPGDTAVIALVAALLAPLAVRSFRQILNRVKDDGEQVVV